jgi:hypothetical protein
MNDSPNFNVLDITRHYVSSRGILNWVLWRWASEPTQPLLIAVENLQAQKMNSKLRVLLSTTRKGMKSAGTSDYQRFGIESEVVQWGPDREALVLKRITTIRHRAIEAFIGQWGNG